MPIVRRSVWVLYIVCAVVALAGSAGATTWDLSWDWSATNNPSGAWYYGHSSTVGGPVTPYIRTTNPPSGQSAWAGTNNYYESYLYGSVNKIQSTGAVILRNGTTTPYYQAVARWQSPVNGSVHVWGRFSWNIAPGVGKARAYICHNGVANYSAIAANWLTYYTWDAQLNVSVGDTIDFVDASDPDYPVAETDFITFAAITTDPVGAATGTVRDATAGHAAVPYAQVTTSDGRLIAVCGSDGSYSLSLPQGTYTLTASAPSYASQTISGITITGSGSTSLDFALGTATVSGAVTSDEPGNPPIAGASVRTLGETSYSATTGTDGSFALSLPGGSFTLLASAAGHDPMRLPISATLGSGNTQYFALRPTAAGAIVALPAPLDWGEPPSAPVPPGDAFPVSFADTSFLPVPGAPRIGGWNETVKPDESFTLTGSGFTTRTGLDLGTDTTVWIWAATPSGGALRQAKIWKVTGEMLTATVPDDIPYGMYLVWVQNSLGTSSPICLNKVRTTFIGPTGNVGWPGATMRVFGKNITRNRSTITSSASVYIQSAGGGAFTQCAITRADPYSAEFIVPAGIASGNYKIYVHNGHGGVYGWSDPLDLVIGTQWVRGSYQYPLSPSGGNDNSRLQTALTTVGSQPNGGTVMLGAGTFYITTGLNIPGNVELRGAGQALTTINVQVTAGVRAFNLMGSRIAMTDLTTYEPNGPMNTWDGLINPPYYVDSTYNRFSNVKFAGAPSTSTISLGRFSEAVNCTFYTTVYPGDSCWVHNCTSLGSRYTDGFEAAYYTGAFRNVFEYNHVETPNWPYDPSKPHPYNYGDYFTGDFDTARAAFIAVMQYIPWNKRVALIYSSNLYAANNTTKDVAASDPYLQGNTGEMFLAHGYPGQWFGNVLGSSGQTLVLRTDGLVNGQVVTVQNYTVTYITSRDQHPLTGGGAIPDGYEGQEYYSRLDDPNSIYGIEIISGRGMGQFRRISSHTPNSVTVETPWLVQPDSTSTAVISRLYLDNTIYKNDLNAFPQGYVQGYSASIGVVIDGHGWGCSVEGNTSHRTCEARQITSGQVSASAWNELRDEAAYDVLATYHQGNVIFQLDAAVNPAGLTSIGNVIHGGQVNVTGGTVVGGNNAGAYGAMSSTLTAGGIVENLTITGKRGLELNGLGNLPPYGSMLTRKCAVSVYDISTLLPSSPQPVFIAQPDDNQILNRNTYSGGTQTYFGASTYFTPLPLNRCARFKGYVGMHFDPIIVPIANGGTQSMTWSAAPSDAWITATVGASPNVGAEADAGRLTVSVDPTGMTAGLHWGYVTVTSGTKSVRVGVCVDLASPLPSSGLKLWLKADAGVTRDGSNNVSAWSDQSGSGNSVTQSSPSAKPVYVSSGVNGYPTVKFSGGDDVMSTAGLVVSGNSPFTTFAVVKPTSTTLCNVFWQGDGSSSGGYGLYLTGASSLAAGWSGSASEILGPSVSSGEWYSAGTSYDGANHTFRVNGVSYGSTAKSDSSFGTGVFSIGNRGPAGVSGLNGEIAELMVYNRNLSDTEKAAVELYIKLKYAMPMASFTSTSYGGTAPVSTIFDASASSSASESIASYAWDFGDGTGTTGVVTSHTYSTPGTYLVTLTVTDDTGNADTAVATITVGSPLAGVCISGNPSPPVTTETPVTLTAVANGGYNVTYKFLLKSGGVWSTLQDFSTSTTSVWTPSSNGYYAIRVLARSADSHNAYDAMGEISYPVGLVPTSGMSLWLRGDSGMTADGTGAVSSWIDQSGAGNSVTQTMAALRPTLIANALDGKPAVRFTSAGQVMQSPGLVITGTSNFTTFTVAKFNSVPGGNFQYIWWNGINDPAAGYGAYISGVSKLRCGWGSQGNYVGDTSSAIAGKWYAMSSRYTSGDHHVWINGTDFGSSAKTDSNFSTGGYFSVGNFGPDTSKYIYYGDVGEILIYGRYLTDAERSSVESYLLAKWSAMTPVSVTQISAAKALSDQTIVSIAAPKVVTCASGIFSGSTYYISEPDRTCGMKVVGGAAVNLWDNVTLTGTIATDSNGEKLLQVSTINGKTAGTSLGTLGMINKICAPSGQLVRVWGKLVDSGSGWFRIDDGSGAPLAVVSDTLVTPLTQVIQPGRYVGVTGIAGKGTGGVTVVRPRNDADIQLY